MWMAAPISTGCIHVGTMRRSSFTPSICLVSDGDYLRKLPLSMRKANLARATGAARRRHPPGTVRTSVARSAAARIDAP